MEGWIKYHRKIVEHYLFEENRVFSRFEAWTYILLMANHKRSKFLLGNELIILDEGQLLTSQSKLMNKFKWSKSKLNNFFTLLIKDNMLLVKSDTKKTTLTIVKYRDYQEQETAKRPLKDHEETAEGLQKDTYKNVKNVKNDNNVNNVKEKKEKAFNFRLSLIDLGVNEKIVEDWMKVRRTKHATNTETAFNKIQAQIEKSGKTANECITLAVEKDWKGFEAEWLKNNFSIQGKLEGASHVHTTKKETIADFGWEEFLKK